MSSEQQTIMKLRYAVNEQEVKVCYKNTAINNLTLSDQDTDVTVSLSEVRSQSLVTWDVHADHR